MSAAVDPLLPGKRVLRVDWVPGSDRLSGTCFCGANAEFQDPTTLWAWLLDHGAHPSGGPAVVTAPATGPREAVVV